MFCDVSISLKILVHTINILMYRLGRVVEERSAHVQEVAGSIPGRVIPETLTRSTRSERQRLFHFCSQKWG